jgi:hypothetical protein
MVVEMIGDISKSLDLMLEKDLKKLTLESRSMLGIPKDSLELSRKDLLIL